MAINCPTCHSDNSDTLKFCGACGTRLDPSAPGRPPGPKDQASFTRTLETGTDKVTRGTIFLSRYEIVEELGATEAWATSTAPQILSSTRKLPLSSSSPRLRPSVGWSNASGTSSRPPGRSAARIYAASITSGTARGYMTRY